VTPADLPEGTSRPGEAVLELVAVMDRLRSPGGCPWDAEQTHASLARYLLEETYEVLEALESGDRDHLREELGDLLLQVVFHARLAAEDPHDPWDVDDVARDISAKLVRRHPHVFAVAPPDGVAGGAAGGTADPVLDSAAVEDRWERQKSDEKGRTSVLDGVPTALPALARADKLLGRLARAGLDVAPIAPGDDSVGARLMALVVGARAAGVDPEAALRATLADLTARVHAAEAARAAEAAGRP
jgi:XTP/dITP diphosphohydrolase